LSQRFLEPSFDETKMPRGTPLPVIFMSTGFDERISDV
jgi:hypothetical protein